jgi:LAS superfamily LD-carboxypeptidase LdcB
MKRLPIKPVNLPKDLRNQANGNLDPKILKPITGSKMHHLAAQAFSAMEAAAKKDKIVLKPTSSVDAYRPLTVQESAFLRRYDNKRRASIPRTWRGKRWWLKPGNAPVAVPGTSNHGWGLAIDIASIDQNKVEWLLKNSATFGFSWELQNEPWHMRYVAGDNVPAAVNAYISYKPKKTSKKVS